MALKDPENSQHHPSRSYGLVGHNTTETAAATQDISGPRPPSPTLSEQQRREERRGNDRESGLPFINPICSDFQWAIKWTYGRGRFIKREERKTHTGTVQGTRGPLLS